MTVVQYVPHGAIPNRGTTEVEQLRPQARACVDQLYSGHIVAGRVRALYDLALCN